MKRVFSIIALATAYLFVYHLAPHIGWSDSVILTMFILSPAVVIFMVFTILKHGKPSGCTFEERCYDDVHPK